LITEDQLTVSKIHKAELEGSAKLRRSRDTTETEKNGARFMPDRDVTEILLRCRGGDKQAVDELMPLVYAELRRLAKSHLRREHPGNTLQGTALVHEAYIRLIDQRQVQWQNRVHFFALASELIRRITSEVHGRMMLRELLSMRMARFM
jgi:hypothetical protein